MRGKGRPFLGICVGMQLMAERGREYVVTEGLGWIRGEVDKIAPSDPALKIPHMGWNTLAARTPHKLLDGIPLGADGLHAYFVHSYQLRPVDGSRPDRAGRLRRADHRDRRARQHGRHSIPPGKEPETWACADRQFPEMEAVGSESNARDPVSRHRSEGRPRRAPRAGRHGARHRVQPRPGGAGAPVRDPGLQTSACRRSRRCLCRQADERRGGRADPGDGRAVRAARRRHPRHGDDRGLARQGRQPRHHRHRGGARSRRW